MERDVRPCRERLDGGELVHLRAVDMERNVASLAVRVMTR